MTWAAFHAAILVLLAPPIAVAQSTSWVQDRQASVAQITQACAGRNCSWNGNSLASGFVFKLPNGQTGILTALHAVCGTGHIFYRFGNPPTGVGDSAHETEIVWAHIRHDLALLRVDPRHEANLRPLQPADNSDIVGQDVTIIGHTGGSSTALDSRASVRLLGPSIADNLSRYWIEYLRSFSFPDLNQPVLRLQNAGRVGDSGAPVFNGDGRVVGVANGGLPEAGATISWAIPISVFQRIPMERFRPQSLDHLRDRCDRRQTVILRNLRQDGAGRETVQSGICTSPGNCIFLVDGAFNRVAGAVSFPFVPIESSANNNFTDALLTHWRNRRGGCDQRTEFSVNLGLHFRELSVRATDSSGVGADQKVTVGIDDRIEVFGCQIMTSDVTHIRRLTVRIVQNAW